MAKQSNNSVYQPKEKNKSKGKSKKKPNKRNKVKSSRGQG